MTSPSTSEDRGGGEWDWELAAKAALAADEGTDEVEVLPRRLPPLLDPEGIAAVMAPLLAGVTWAAAVLRDQMAETPLDPIGLLLRLIALALTVRATLLGLTLVRRVRTWLTTRRHGLALTDHGMVLRLPAGDLALRREDVVDVRERGDWRRRSGGRRWSEVYLLVRPERAPGPLPYVTIPPVLERTPGVLAERLMRWRGVVQGPEEPSWPEPDRLGSKVYERAAAGQAPPGGFVVRHGKGWLKRGPYATLLLSVIIVEGFLRLPPEAWALIGPGYPVAIAACLALVPAGWLVLTRRHVGPRKGIALVLTPAEVLMRTREGVLRAQWRKLRRAYVEAKSGWSLVEGYHLARKLVLERDGAPTIRYDEAFLGIPAEVAQALCEAYKKGTLPGEGRVGAT